MKNVHYGKEVANPSMENCPVGKVASIFVNNQRGHLEMEDLLIYGGQGQVW